MHRRPSDTSLDPALVDAVRRAHAEPVEEATTRRHVAAMVAAAAEVDLTATPAVDRRPARLRPALRRTATAAAVLVGSAGATTGLAVAGVSLPDPVQAPFEAVGVSLPNQADDAAAPARRVPVAPPATTPASPRERDEAERTERGRSEDRRRDDRSERKDRRTDPAGTGAGEQRRERPETAPAPKAPRTKPAPSSSRRGRDYPDGADLGTPATPNRARDGAGARRRDAERREAARERARERAAARARRRARRSAPVAPSVTEPAPVAPSEAVEPTTTGSTVPEPTG